MTFKECRELIKMDKSRFVDIGNKRKIYTQPTFMVTYWFRIGSWLNSKHNLLARSLKGIVCFFYKWLCVATGIQLPIGTNVGGGIIFRHYSNIVFALTTVVGNMCTFHHGVTLGRIFSGKKAGVPTLEDHVVVFPGAKIIGNVHIGSHAVIGANAVVTIDVPNYCVAAGVPAKIVSNDSRKCFDEYGRSLFDF